MCYKSSAESWCQCEYRRNAWLRWHSIEIQFVGIIVLKQEQNVNKTDTLSKVCMRCHFFFFSLFTLCHCFRFRALPVFLIVTLIYSVSLFSPSVIIVTIVWWFRKMFTCFWFKQKAIHSNFIWFHERELLSCAQVFTWLRS